MASCKHLDACNAECVSRSEIQALLREIINTLKHTMDTDNVCAHMLDISSFEQIKEYIRGNLSHFTIISDKCSKRKLCLHHKRILKLLSIEKSYDQEYKRSVVNVYKKQTW
ncbi:lef-11 [Palpita vitrealis nucleopolyhedrovirus]|uniref:Late expression factor 11 n=1 Tax=Palpita vitrealis nucleopolyhedrovirus TaxID=2951960 RepID=A0AAE9RYR8_9ABAC|nr:lef-11 [Palpita vitrealis nucleopolyhedrovirus]